MLFLELVGYFVALGQRRVDDDDDEEDGFTQLVMGEE